MDLAQFHEVLAAQCGLAQDRPLVVGFSGGPDSLCLLDSLARLAFPVIAAHFDHQLRPDSGRDAQAARRIAEQRGIPFVSEAGDVSAFAQNERLSIEEAARLLRYRFLFAQARRFSAQAVAVGHTADDQVETLLLHLLRGTGLAGLSGMRHRAEHPQWDPEIPLVRPLLGYWREEILACCQERGLTPVIDPSNLGTDYLRNRMRHEVIPFLEQYNPQARKGLWRTAQILAADADVLQAAVEQALADCQARFEQGAVGLRLDCFQQLALGLQRAVLRKAASHLKQNARDLDFAAVERGAAWARRAGAGQVDLTLGLRLFIESGWVWVATEDAAPPAEWPQMMVDRLELPLPGQVEAAPGWVMTASFEEPGCVPEKFDTVSAGVAWEAWLDAGALPQRLIVRKPALGDRFQPLGMEHGTQKLSDFWVNQKLPRRARSSWPLVATEDAIVWVPGFRPAHAYRVRPETGRVLHLRLARD